MKDIDLRITTNFHWSSIEACLQLERVRLRLRNNAEAGLAGRCMLDLKGCNPACFNHITELNLEADIFHEDGQLRGLNCRKMKYVILHMWEPQISVFDISHLTRAKWVSSSVRGSGYFTCFFENYHQ